MAHVNDKIQICFSSMNVMMFNVIYSDNQLMKHKYNTNVNEMLYLYLYIYIYMYWEDSPKSSTDSISFLLNNVISDRNRMQHKHISLMRSSELNRV